MESIINSSTSDRTESSRKEETGEGKIINNKEFRQRVSQKKKNTLRSSSCGIEKISFFQINSENDRVDSEVARAGDLSKYLKILITDSSE